jgi:hypothetical protein
MTPFEFYITMLVNVAVDLDIDIMMRKDKAQWMEGRGFRAMGYIEDGWVIFCVDLGDRVVAARRTQQKTVKWIGKKPRQGDLMKLKMLLPNPHVSE